MSIAAELGQYFCASTEV